MLCENLLLLGDFLGYIFHIKFNGCFNLFLGLSLFFLFLKFNTINANISTKILPILLFVRLWLRSTAIIQGWKTKFLIYVKLVLISDTYCILIYCYVALLPFKKLVLVLKLSKAWRNSQSKAV